MPKFITENKLIVVCVLALISLLPLFHSNVTISGEAKEYLEESLDKRNQDWDDFHDDVDDIIDDVSYTFSRQFGIKTKDLENLLENFFRGRFSLLNFQAASKYTLDSMMDDDVEDILRQAERYYSDFDYDDSVAQARTTYYGFTLLILAHFVLLGLSARDIYQKKSKITYYYPVVVTVTTALSVYIASTVNEEFRILFNLLSNNLISSSVDTVISPSLACFLATAAAWGIFFIWNDETVPQGDGIDLTMLAENEMVSKLTNTIINVGQNMSDSTKNMAEINRLNSQINSVKGEINLLKQTFGNDYFDAVEHTESVDHAEFMSKMKALNATLVELEEKVKVLKGISLCTACQKEVNLNTPFCPHCGTALSNPAPVVEPGPVVAPVVPETPPITPSPPPAQYTPPAPPAPPTPPSVPPEVPPVVEKASLDACPACQTPKKEGDLFCQKCGTKLVN